MRLFYYLILLPLSSLPFGVLYGFSNVLYVLMYTLSGYRKKVVRTNIQNSFPELSTAQHRKIERQFYRHFCDLVVESIKTFTISKEELQKRFRHRNQELFQKYFDEGRHVTLVGGHTGNWEMFAVSFALHVPHQTMAIYTPLANRFMNSKMQISRSRFGLVMDNYTSIKQQVAKPTSKPIAVIFGADQSPNLKQQPYWMEFLNQETGVQFGLEKFAVTYNAPVIYGYIHRLKRGHYEIEYRLITDIPTELPYGAITEMHTRMLESDIRKTPYNWLWTHKRWKRKKSDYKNLPN